MRSSCNKTRRFTGLTCCMVYGSYTVWFEAEWDLGGRRVGLLTTGRAQNRRINIEQKLNIARKHDMIRRVTNIRIPRNLVPRAVTIKRQAHLHGLCLANDERFDASERSLSYK